MSTITNPSQTLISIYDYEPFTKEQIRETLNNPHLWGIIAYKSTNKDGINQSSMKKHESNYCDTTHHLNTTLPKP